MLFYTKEELFTYPEIFGRRVNYNPFLYLLGDKEYDKHNKQPNKSFCNEGQGSKRRTKSECA